MIVYLNYSLLGDKEVILEDIESNFRWSWIIYGVLIVCTLAFGIKSIFLAKKENKNLLYAFIGIILAILSLSVFGDYYIKLFLAF